MYTLKKYNNIPTTKQELYKLINSKKLYIYFLSGYKLNEYYKSPFKFRNDTKPSFIINVIFNEYNELEYVWRDFGIDSRYHDFIDYIKYYYYNVKTFNYNQCIKFIYNNIYQSQKFETIINNNIELLLKNDKPISIDAPGIVYRKKLKDFELDYWKDYYFNSKELLWFKVYSCKMFSKYNNILIHESKKNDRFFIYLFNKEKKIYKAYRPDAESYRFITSNTTNHIQGYDFLIKNNTTLIITKSYKDVMVLTKLGIPSIAPHSENQFIDELKLKELKKRFKNIYILYDNDYMGITYSKIFSNKYELKNIIFPKIINKIKIKDASDVVKHFNYKKLYKLLSTKINLKLKRLLNV